VPKPNPVSVFLEERGIKKTRLADTCGVGPVQLSKYVCGARRLTGEQRRSIMVEWPKDAEELIVLFDLARRGWQDQQPLRFSRPAARVALEESTREPEAEPDDGESYTIEEWKERFGEPGLFADVHGRVWGYFATDPDFCE
jgi:hypothetical protein